MRVAGEAALCFVTAWGLLEYLYPVERELEYGRKPAVEWLWIYSALAALLAVVVIAIAAMTARAVPRPLRAAVVACMTTATLLTGWAFWVGTMSMSSVDALPMGEIHAKFLREFAYVKFLLVGIGMALLSGLLAYRRRAASGT